MPGDRILYPRGFFQRLFAGPYPLLPYVWIAMSLTIAGTVAWMIEVYTFEVWEGLFLVLTAVTLIVLLYSGAMQSCRQYTMTDRELRRHPSLLAFWLGQVDYLVGIEEVNWYFLDTTRFMGHPLIVLRLMGEDTVIEHLMSNDGTAWTVWLGLARAKGAVEIVPPTYTSMPSLEELDQMALEVRKQHKEQV